MASQGIQRTNEAAPPHEPRAQAKADASRGNPHRDPRSVAPSLERRTNTHLVKVFGLNVVTGVALLTLHTASGILLGEEELIDNDVVRVDTLLPE